MIEENDEKPRRKKNNPTLNKMQPNKHTAGDNFHDRTKVPLWIKLASLYELGLDSKSHRNQLMLTNRQS